jgi:hypothetical protein
MSMELSQPAMFMGAFVLALITIVAVVVLWRGMEVARTQIGGERERKYAKLAEEAVDFQRRAADQLEVTRQGIEEIRQRLVAVEKLLREVG